jgi:hypothetical protein
MGRARSAHGKYEILLQNYVGIPDGKYHAKDIGVDRRIILE